MKKDNKPEYIKAIEAKPKEERTIEEFKALGNWQIKNPSTLEEKKIVAKTKKAFAEMQESINRTLKLLGVENAPPEEQNRAFMLHLKQKEEALKEREKQLKEREAKLEAKKKRTEETKKHIFVSGHLIDQTLKRDRATALDLFDVLNSRDVENIKDTNVELNSVFEGVNLTPLQDEILLTLIKLKGESFKSIVPIEAISSKWDKLELTTAFGGGREEDDLEEIPIIFITPYEFTKELKGANPSGRTQNNTEKALIDLSRNKYLMREIKRYERIGKGGRKHWTQKESVGYKSLITVEDSTITSGVDDTVETERRVLKIMLNPICVRDLTRKYIYFPNDIVVRTIEANGSPRVSSVVLLLRNYLARALSNKNRAKEKTDKSIVNTISLKKLFETIQPSENERKKKKRLNDNFKRALEVCKKIGLLEKYEYRTSSKGEKQIAFFIYQKWE